MEYLHAEHQGIFRRDKAVTLRGMGLGGWFLPEGYMWKLYTKCDRPRRMEALIEKLCGKQYAEQFWEHYYDSYITESDIRWIFEQGLNSVRIPLNARHLFSVDSYGEMTLNLQTVERLDACLQWCKKYNLYAFLDMHAAPGGQTGQNIDDSEKDIPELFCDDRNRKLLIRMWELLAMRYANEPVVGGYDLLNEPLPEWQKQYNSQLLPLYRSLIHAIRQIDKKHIIILEGLHWDTDFSVFDEFTKEEAADNIVLEFHKYWSNPDKDSLTSFINTAERLDVPLWMGEGGENNLEWYTSVFPLYERLNIGWCFWSYKKMDSRNSPVTFEQPQLWEKLLSYLDGGQKPDTELAQRMFDSFLYEISHPKYQPEVIHALLRKPYVVVPAFAYDEEQINKISLSDKRIDFRKESKAALLFKDGHTGSPDWRRYAGESQPEEQCILLSLKKGDAVGYKVLSGANDITVTVKATGEGTLLVEDRTEDSPLCWKLASFDKDVIWLSCTKGEFLVEEIIVNVIKRR